MQNNVKIIGDSTCDMPRDLREKHDIDIAPLYVELDGKNYRDGIDLTADRLLSICEKKKTAPKTSATSVGDLIDLFRKYVEQDREIIFFPISSHLSAEYQNARLAAAEFPGKSIHVIDGKSLSFATGLLILEAAGRAEKGMPAADIVREVGPMVPKLSTTFVVDTLSFLRRGGRCSGLTAFGAAMLSIKPMIHMVDGRLEPGAKFRGNMHRVMRRYIQQHLEGISGIRPERAAVVYTSLDEEMKRELVETVRATGYFKEVLLVPAGCVISSHAGPGTMGLLYMNR